MRGISGKHDYGLTDAQLIGGSFQRIRHLHRQRVRQKRNRTHGSEMTIVARPGIGRVDELAKTVVPVVAIKIEVCLPRRRYGHTARADTASAVVPYPPTKTPTRMIRVTMPVPPARVRACLDGQRGAGEKQDTHKHRGSQSRPERPHAMKYEIHPPQTNVTPERTRCNIHARPRFRPASPAAHQSPTPVRTRGMGEEGRRLSN